MSVSVVIILDTRRVKKKTGKYPVKLLVTFNSEQKRYQTIYDLTQPEFDNLSASQGIWSIKNNPGLTSSKFNVQLKTQPIPCSHSVLMNLKKDYILNNAFFRQRKFIRAVMVPATNEFNVAEYEEHRFPIFKLPNPEPDALLATTLYYINKPLSEHRIRTAASYQTAYMTVSRFRGNVRFIDIDVGIPQTTGSVDAGTGIFQNNGRHL